MTEQEKTEMAILRAKADAKNKEIQEKLQKDKEEQEKMNKEVEEVGEVEEVEKVEESKKVEETKESKEIEVISEDSEEPKKEPKKENVDIKKYPFKVELGKNKVAYFKPWTGKTKKKFRKVFEQLQDPEDLDLNDVIQVLLRDNLSDPDMYISENEQQYLMAVLRKESIEDKFEFEAECPLCSHEQNVKTSITESVKYEKNQFPKTIDQVLYKDIENNTIFNNTIKNILNADDYDGITSNGDIEIAMHLEFKDAKTPEKILDEMDEMALNDIQTVLSNLESVSSKIEMSVEKTCSGCGKNVKFVTTEIPELFESLLK